MPDALTPAAVVDPGDVAALLGGSAGAVIMRDVVTVEGPDAVAYLQGQLSQDITGLTVGASALTFLLEPQGRIVAILRAHRVADDAVTLDADPGVGEAVVVRLNRFKLRTKADVTLTADVPYLVYRGADPAPRGAVIPTLPGASGWDLPPSADPPAPLTAVPGVVVDAVRVKAGVPAAQDLDDRAVPAETGLVEAAASFTKGCYTGQELVARMDSRAAQPPRRVRVVIGPSPAPPAGAQIQTDDGRAAGTVTSVVLSDETWSALALVPRAIDEASVAATAVWADGRVEATVLP